MSIAAVEKFLNKASQDEALQSQLKEALTADNDREAVTQLANQQGYEFSSEELWAEVQKRQAELEQKKQTGELSDEELEAVAGGELTGMATVATVMLTVAAVASAGGSAVGTYFGAKAIEKNVKW